MFDFSHSYAAKVGALFAMFLIALVFFELLPELHRYVLELMNQPLRLLGINLIQHLPQEIISEPLDSAHPLPDPNVPVSHPPTTPQRESLKPS